MEKKNYFKWVFSKWYFWLVIIIGTFIDGGLAHLFYFTFAGFGSFTFSFFINTLGFLLIFWTYYFAYWKGYENQI